MVWHQGGMWVPSPSAAPHLEELELYMSRFWLPNQAKETLSIPSCDGKGHEAKGWFQVGIGGCERSNQRARLCVLTEAHGLDLERWGWW